MKFNFDDFVECENDNINLINSYADSADRKDACRQLQTDVRAVGSRIGTELAAPAWDKCAEYSNASVNSKSCQNSNRDAIKQCAVEVLQKLSATKRKLQQAANTPTFNLVTQPN